MKNKKIIEKIISGALCGVFCLLLLRGFPARASSSAVLNVAEATYGQTQLCEGRLIDDFEDGLDMWSALSDKTAIYTEQSSDVAPFSGKYMLSIDGEPTQSEPLGCKLSFTKLPDYSAY